jgi:hypothetical protein
MGAGAIVGSLFETCERPKEKVRAQSALARWHRQKGKTRCRQLQLNCAALLPCNVLPFLVHHLPGNRLAHSTTVFSSPCLSVVFLAAAIYRKASSKFV